MRMGMIQIRNVPEALHRKLKARAAEAGMSLSDYLLREISNAAEVPTWAEMRKRLASRSKVELPEGTDIADIIREEREARAAHLEAVLRDRD
jgi:plasmid stability protein